MGVTEKLHEKGERGMVTAWLGDGQREERDKRLGSLEPHARTAQGSSRDERRPLLSGQQGQRPLITARAGK